MEPGTELVEQARQVAVPDPFTSMIERLATDHRVDPDKIERFIAMDRERRAENARMEFDSALADMQPEIPSIGERGNIEHSGKHISSYALYEDINDVIKPILHKYGFALSHRLAYPEKQIVITGILSHRAGHREQTQFIAEADTTGSKNSIQARKSTISYGMRTVTCALLNITTRGLDDDGRAGGTAALVNADQVENIKHLMESAKVDSAKFLKYLKVATVEDIAESSYLAVVGLINERAKHVA